MGEQAPTFPAPNKGEHFALGEPVESLSEAKAVYREAVNLTNQMDPGDTLYPTEHSRAQISELARGGNPEEMALVSRDQIPQARKNIDRYKPKELRNNE